METKQCTTTASDVGLFLIRAILAVVFMYHGSQKLFGAFGGPGLTNTANFMTKLNIPMPMVSATLAACAEFFGGLALLLGIGVRLVVIPMAFTMLVAIVTVHSHAFALPQGMEYALTLGIILVALGLLGPGRITLMCLFSKKSPPMNSSM